MLPVGSPRAPAISSIEQEAKDEARLREALGALSRAEEQEQETTDVSLEELLQGVSSSGADLEQVNRNLDEQIRSVGAAMVRAPGRREHDNDIETAIDDAVDLAAERTVNKLFEQLPKQDAKVNPRIQYDSKMAHRISNSAGRRRSAGQNTEGEKTTEVPGGVDPIELPANDSEEKINNDHLVELPEEKVVFKSEVFEDMNDPNKSEYQYPGVSLFRNESAPNEPIRAQFPTFPIDPTGG